MRRFTPKLDLAIGETEFAFHLHGLRQAGAARQHQSGLWDALHNQRRRSHEVDGIAEGMDVADKQDCWQCHAARWGVLLLRHGFHADAEGDHNGAPSRLGAVQLADILVHRGVQADDAVPAADAEAPGHPAIR